MTNLSFSELLVLKNILGAYETDDETEKYVIHSLHSKISKTLNKEEIRRGIKTIGGVE